jgi:hypothetical protein
MIFASCYEFVAGHQQQPYQHDILMIAKPKPNKKDSSMPFANSFDVSSSTGWQGAVACPRFGPFEMAVLPSMLALQLRYRGKRI